MDSAQENEARVCVDESQRTRGPEGTWSLKKVTKVTKPDLVFLMCTAVLECLLLTSAFKFT